MAPWPFSSTSSSPSTSNTLPSSPPTTTQPTHAPTGAPLPSPSQTSNSSPNFTTANPVLPPPPPSPSDPLQVSFTPPPTTPTTTDLPPPVSANLRPLFLTLLVACPALALLPPRKLDLYTFSLAGAWVLSAEELARGQRFGWGQMRKAEGVPVAGAEERLGYDGRRRREEMGKMPASFGALARGGGEGDELQEGEREREKEKEKEKEEGGGVSSMAKKLWMGSEKEGWKERRLREEREKLAEGKGYAELIGDTVEQAFRERTGRIGDPDDVEEEGERIRERVGRS